MTPGHQNIPSWQEDAAKASLSCKSVPWREMDEVTLQENGKEKRDRAETCQQHRQGNEIWC